MRSCLPAAVAAALLPIVSTAPAGAAEPADGWIRLFNGKDLTGWKHRDQRPSRWTACVDAGVNPADPTKLEPLQGRPLEAKPEENVLLCKAVSPDLLTEAEFGDYELHLEFLIPKGSNSGVYNRGLWEVQILDSFGKATLDFGDCGSLYGRRVCPVNAAREPGKWQTFDVTVRDFAMTVVWNGVKVHEGYDIRWTELKSKADYERIIADGKSAAEPGVVDAAKAEAEAAKNRFDRAAAFAKQNLISKSELDQARAARDRTAARLRALTDAAGARLEERNGKFYKWAGEGPTTAGLSRRDTSKGPILLQGDHGDVAFRDIRIRPLR
jgi:hypothetical protein